MSRAITIHISLGILVSQTPTTTDLEFLKHELQPLPLSSHKSVPKAYELYNFTSATAPFLGAIFFFLTKHLTEQLLKGKVYHTV